jgi:asparagine synthase (glutamine-hydrolysing)
VWWSLPDVIARARRNAPPADAADAAAQLLTRLRASVATRLEADVPLGAFLSGGMDSSLVAAVAQEALGSRRLRTFTIAMPSLGYDESAEAAGVARHLGTEHTCVELSAAEAMALIPKLPEIYDEPLADPSCLPSALVCAAARKELTAATRCWVATTAMCSATPWCRRPVASRRRCAAGWVVRSVRSARRPTTRSVER